MSFWLGVCCVAYNIPCLVCFQSILEGSVEFWTKTIYYPLIEGQIHYGMQRGAKMCWVLSEPKLVVLHLNSTTIFERASQVERNLKLMKKHRWEIGGEKFLMKSLIELKDNSSIWMNQYLRFPSFFLHLAGMYTSHMLLHHGWLWDNFVAWTLQLLATSNIHLTSTCYW